MQQPAVGGGLLHSCQVSHAGQRLPGPALTPRCPLPVRTRARAQASTRLYLKAVEWLEDAGKDALAGDVFRCGGLAVQ